MGIFQEYLNRNGLTSQKHQLEGIAWCKKIEREGVVLGEQRIHGGLLADEMGLGKTIQMIGLILENLKLHTLIVLPRCLLEQWEVTIRDSLGHQAMVYHGASAKQVIKKEILEESPIVLTTYGMIAGQKDGKYGLLHEVKWDRIIFDEAHHMRNRGTMIHKAGVEISSSHKWLVTGTPIQNGLPDFYGLCEVMGLEEDYYNKRENLKKIVERLILKRTKKEVGIKLPELIKKTRIVPWENTEEKQLAEDIHYLLEFSKIDKPPTSNVFNNLSHHFVILHRARQSCISMELMKSNLEKLQDLNVLDKDLDLDKLKNFKSKINYVLKTIKKNKDNGNKKLIFCHFRTEINRIVSGVREMGLVVGVFDGRTGVLERNELLNNSKMDILVLQIKTGCEGLNLQEFNEIYFVSPHWNPAVEDQAIARCHRMNQKKPVIVYSFKMEAFDAERRTQNLDMHVKKVQQSKRLEMKLIEKEKEEERLLDKENKSIICAICLDDIKTTNNVQLECGHYYHNDCLSKWFNKGSGCPTCRQ